MPTLSPLVAPYVVVMTAYGATSGEKLGIMITLSLQWMDKTDMHHDRGHHCVWRWSHTKQYRIKYDRFENFLKLLIISYTFMMT